MVKDWKRQEKNSMPKTRRRNYCSKPCCRVAVCLSVFLFVSYFVLRYQDAASSPPKIRTQTSANPLYDAFQPTSEKVIYGATDYWQAQLWKELMNFTGCEYSNCTSANSSTFVGVNQADVLIFALDYIKMFPQVPREVRMRQNWLIISYESSAYDYNRFKPFLNNQFNGSMTFRRDSTIYYPWGKTIPVKDPHKTPIDFVQNKTKGAFSYISNCESLNYDRLKTVDILAQYIDIDIFGKCKGLDPPCPPLRKGGNPVCETRAHRSYRFFISFENSLCKDYITEKFWDRLQSSSYFVPIAMGGLSLEEYTSVAPPDSFLHVYNFTSVHELGEHLQYLMNNDDAYNRYHEWRYEYDITTDRNIAACELCKMANEKPALPAMSHIDQWWNDEVCRTF